jgi:outer membrane protein assembly factor BamD (BamD/ComL family)
MTNCLPVQRRRGTWAFGRNRALAWATFTLASFAGCKTGIDASALQPDNEAVMQQMTNTDDVHGPMERFLQSLDWREENKKKKVHFVNPPEAMAAYHKGEELMKQKKYKEAQDAFWKECAEKFKDYPIREDATFMSGECYYFQQLYADAEDQYSLVVKEYTATKHLDEISRRKFEIARRWLGFTPQQSGIITAGDVKPVNFEDPSSTPAPTMDYKEPSGITYTVPILPNFTDKTRPWFDTTGRALDALKSIWLNDPTGPLADDALMLSASYYLRKGDYVEADHLYDLLRKEFPKSRHTENAYVLGAHCKLMCYQGPEYGGTELEEAKKLMEQTMHLYPNRSDRARMEADLKRIELAKAAQLWANVKFWKVKAKPKAVAISCKEIIQKFPNSDYARMAREELAKIKPEDKVDIPHPKYEDNATKASFNSGPPDAFDDQGSRPKRMPSSADGADPSKM